MNKEFVILPEKRLRINLDELWTYRELFYFFTWRDIKVKYKQTVFGFLWAIIQPMFMALVFTLFLGETISNKTQMIIPYPLFAISGMIIWNVFSGGMSNSANSMLSNANIIKKIYFPRLIIPVSAILVSLVDFLVALVVFFIILFFYDVKINLCNLFLIPVALFITCLSAIGVGTFLAALNIKYRDVKYIIPFLVQGMLFLTPVLYPINISTNPIVQKALMFNPIAGSLELMRSVFVGYEVDLVTIMYSVLSSLVLFFIGIIYFKKTESYFADLI